MLSKLARDPQLDPQVRIAAAAAFGPHIPSHIIEAPARSLLAAADPVLRARGLILVGQFCLTGLRAELDARLGDPGGFWELDSEVRLARLAEGADRILVSGEPEPAFPDWSQLALPPWEGPEPATPYLGLRNAALTRDPASIGVTPANFPHPVVAVVVDLGLDEGVYTLACSADGATSIYLSDGSGTEGFGDFDSVREATRVLMAIAQAHYAGATVVTEFPPARRGRVRFFLRGFEDVRGFDVAEPSLMTEGHPLARLYDQAHAVLEEAHSVEHGMADR